MPEVSDLTMSNLNMSKLTISEPSERNRIKIIKEKMKYERNRRDKIINERYERHLQAYQNRTTYFFYK